MALARERPPVGALLLAVDVQLAEEEALVLGRVRGRLGDGRAALGRRRAGPPRLPPAGVLGPWPAPGFGPVPGPRPVGPRRLLGQTVGKAGQLPPSLFTQREGQIVQGGANGGYGASSTREGQTVPGRGKQGGYVPNSVGEGHTGVAS